MNELPILDCDGCIACCMEQGSPPGYLSAVAGTTERPFDDADNARYRKIPAVAIRVITVYAGDLLSGRVTGEGPCVWLNLETKRCQWYEHRPQICRDFKVGCGACQSWRKQYPTAAARQGE